MVRYVEERCHTVSPLKQAYHRGDELIRLTHGIVVGIAEIQTISLRARIVPLHGEERLFLRVAVSVAEVTAIGVQHHQELRMLTRQESLQVGKHIAVVEAALLTTKLLAYRMMLIALHCEEVHVAMIAWLIGDEGRIEARFTEGSKEPFYPRQLRGRSSISRREKDGHALIGRIRLRQHIGEGD